MDIDIDIKPSHQSFGMWDLYIDGQFINQYGTYARALSAAQFFLEPK